MAKKPRILNFTPIDLPAKNRSLSPEETRKEINVLGDYPPFNPESTGYDYQTAAEYGIKPDETGHWPSREPKTGQILKGKNHPTFYKTVEGENEAGYEIFKGE